MQKKYTVNWTFRDREVYFFKLVQLLSTDRAVESPCMRMLYSNKFTVVSYGVFYTGNPYLLSIDNRKYVIFILSLS
jgi:allophanate hydrolase subunit 1